MGCIYTEPKNYPREPAAHVAIRETFHYLFSCLSVNNGLIHGLPCSLLWVTGVWDCILFLVMCRVALDPPASLWVLSFSG